MSATTSPVELIGSGHVLLRLHADGVANIHLNQPETSNSIDTDMLKALTHAATVCHGDKRVRVVVLTASGKNFCGGGDVNVFISKGKDLPDHVRVVASHLEAAINAIVHLKAPVVTAVQGFAAGGGGMGLVCASDIVIAGESSNYLAGATRVGMAPDAGLSVTLARIVGFRKAMEILLANPVIKAPEAHAMGLVNKVVPDEQLEAEAFAFARLLARGAPAALGATKRLLWGSISLSVEAAMPEESRTVAALSGTADAREGLAAVVERRKPNFTGE